MNINQSAKLRNVTLEMSLKPFREFSETAVRRVAREACRQWAPLLREAEGMSLLLWTADGSEILEYRGEPADRIEWARYIGHANATEPVKGDPEKQALHSRPYLYMENPPALTCGQLAMIVRVLRETAREATGLPVRIGATFDPGGEFARSPFKYEKHNEICLAGTMGKGSFVCCYAVLKGDTARYAGFPKGIPQGTPFGTFLGRQCQRFLTDLGFDYVWFSNGFGFGLETWKVTGPLFDGKEFKPDRANELREKILDFWRSFRRECPAFPIETRGTNLLAGSDLASNGTPLSEIYSGGFNAMTPPNSPWAALNGDFGLELVGYMTRIAELPEGKGYPFRFYTHDPWWLNSPWLDRYGREAHDIHLPMSISRLNAKGEIENPVSLSLLTIDNSYGQMPDQVPNEVIPHLLTGLRVRPDQPGPLVWVYPLAEYQERVFKRPARLEEPFFGDWFMRAAVNNCFPLSTVVSSTNFLSSLKLRPDLYRESVLVTPVPDADSLLEKALLGWLRQGGRILFYGPIAHAGREWLRALNLRPTAPLSGEMNMELSLFSSFREPSGQPYPKRMEHRPSMSAGGMEAELQDAGDEMTHLIATATQALERRAAALWRASRDWAGGMAGWVRGTNSHSYKGGHLLTPDDPEKFFAGDLLMRFLLDAFGIRLLVGKSKAAQRNPVLTISRHNNGFFFSGFTPDLTTGLDLRFPQGAPLFTGSETELTDGCACYRMPRAWHRECRVFLEQDAGEVSCLEHTHEAIGLTRRLKLTGLQKAVLRFYPEDNPSIEYPEWRDRLKLSFLLNPVFPFVTGDFLKAEPHNDVLGRYLKVGPVTGPLLISW